MEKGWSIHFTSVTSFKCYMHQEPRVVKFPLMNWNKSYQTSFSKSQMSFSLRLWSSTFNIVTKNKLLQHCAEYNVMWVVSWNLNFNSLLCTVRKLWWNVHRNGSRYVSASWKRNLLKFWTAGHIWTGVLRFSHDKSVLKLSVSRFILIHVFVWMWIRIYLCQF